jgi:hypothetical protein
MCQECRHIMPGGAKWHSPAMRGMTNRYFHAPVKSFRNDLKMKSLTLLAGTRVHGHITCESAKLRQLASPASQAVYPQP